jgi:pimeloyl-ACP methyl ester carboxylesterase
MSEKTWFASGKDICAAWVTLPQGLPPFPVVVLVHGGGAVHDMKLPQYENAFSRAGLAVVAFDYRHFGDSGGQPRQILNVRRQLEDVDAALAFVASHPAMDRSRVALWGTSFGASHVITAAARHSDIAAAVVQCPVLRGRALAFVSGWRNLGRLAWPIVADLGRAIMGGQRRYVLIAGRPCDIAFVTIPGAIEGWQAVADGSATFQNSVAAASGLRILTYDASRRASKVECPLLVCVSDRENLMDPSIAVRVAETARRGEALHYDADHFEVYFQPLFGQMVADQARFLRRHLKIDASDNDEGIA